jgi:hypothetical protein
MTMLEAMIAVGVFATVMAMVLQAVMTGGQMQTSIANSDEAGNRVARSLATVTNDLRYADVNRIYLDGTAWTMADAGSDYYSFKVCTGFAVTPGTTKPSLNSLVEFRKGIVLRITPNGDGTASLFRTELALKADGTQESVVEADRLITADLAWEYTAADGKAYKGFEVTQLDPSQSAVVGNRLAVRAAAFVGEPDASGSRPYRQVHTSVYLRASMYDNVGLQPPVITSPETATFYEGTTGIYDIVATNDATRFAASGLPSGLACDVYSGRVTGTPASGAAGTYNAVVSAYNDVGGDAQPLAITVKGPLPVFTCDLALNRLVGEAADFQVTASNGAYAFAVTGLPPGMSATSTGLITGSSSMASTWNAAMSATNSSGTSYATLRVTITAGTLPVPEIQSPTTAIGTVNQAFSYQIAASNSPTGYAASGLPSGMSANSQTGLISGTSTITGTWSVTITATNASGTGAAIVTITIQEPSPIITSATAVSGLMGTPLTHVITFLNGPATTTTGTLPSWMTFNPSATAGPTLSGTPNAVGTYPVQVTVTNGTGSAMQYVAFSISTPPAPVISPLASYAATKGTVFSLGLASITSHNPTDYGASNLPPGLVLATTTGDLTGTPTEVGTYEVALSATNAGGTGTATTVITVAAPAGPSLALADGVFTAKKTGKVTTYELQVRGTVTPGATTVNYDTFSLTYAPTPATAPTVELGWSTKKTSALAANEFLITVSNYTPTLTITATVADGNGTVGTKTRDY